MSSQPIAPVIPSLTRPAVRGQQDGPDPVGAENYVTLRGLGVLVNQAAQPVPAQNLDTWACGSGYGRPVGGLWRSVRCGRWVL
jgi:hypothetical protein